MTDREQEYADLREIRSFWKDVYIAAIREGWPSDEAGKLATKARDTFIIEHGNEFPSLANG